MATQPKTDLAAQFGAFGVSVWEWVLNPGDDGDDLILPLRSDKTFEIEGINGHTVVIEGANRVATPTSYFTVRLADGTTLASFTADTMETVLANPYRIRPRATGGTGQVTIRVTVRGAL